MILEENVLELLEEGGFTSAFTDYRSRQQPAPYTQLFFFDENEEEAADKRIICIRSVSGGFGNKFVQNPSVDLYIAGLQDRSDTATIIDFAERIYTYFLDTRKKCGIIDVKPASGALTPMLTESGRPIVTLTLNLKIDRGAE